MVKNTSLYYQSSIVLIIVAFLPFVDSFNSTIVNMIRLMAAMGLIFSLASKKIIGINLVIILGFSMIVNLIFYAHVWSVSTTFFNFMSRSMLCWIYGLVGLSFINSDNRSRNGLLNVLLLIISFTCITTIIGAINDPEIIRFTVTGGIESAHDKQMVYRRNIASWNTIYSLIFTLPVWIESYVDTKRKKYLITAIIIFVTIVFSQITFALVFASIIVFGMYLEYKAKRKMLIASIFTLAAFIAYFMRREIIDLLIEVFDRVGLEMLRTRMYQLKVSMNMGELYGTGNARIELYGRSLNAFIKNPFIGYSVKSGRGSSIGMHSQLFDILGGTGVLGATMIIISFALLVKLVGNYIKGRRERVFYYLNIFVLILYITVNPIWGSPASFFGVFSMPVLYSLTKLNREDVVIVTSKIG